MDTIKIVERVKIRDDEIHGLPGGLYERTVTLSGHIVWTFWNPQLQNWGELIAAAVNILEEEYLRHLGG